MTPTPFEGSNRKLLPSGHEYSLNVGSIEPLHIYTDGEQCVSRWVPTALELVALNEGASIWIHILCGENQPPVGPRVGFALSDTVDADQ
jgi:hypothetical protein